MVDDRHVGLKRRSQDRNPWGLGRTITVTNILTIGALLFSVGANYQRINSMYMTLQDFIASADRSYVRQDVSKAQWDSVTYQLQELRSQVDVLTDIVMRQDVARQRPPAAPSPRFPRN